MPHEDGAAYHPIVATVSLAAPTVLDIYDKRRDEQVLEDAHARTGSEPEVDSSRPQYRILQERRSLLITTGSLYSDYLHGIAETKRDDDLRQETVCNWGLLGDRQCYENGAYDRETRISLTYRDVLKVSKLGNSLKFLSKR